MILLAVGVRLSTLTRCGALLPPLFRMFIAAFSSARIMWSQRFPLLLAAAVCTALFAALALRQRLTVE